MIPALTPGTVHLWVRPAEEEGRGDPHRAGHFNKRSQEDLARILARYRSPLPPTRRGEHGKPFLEGGPEFNLSHSGGGSAVAISLEPVGVDIEDLRRRPDCLGIARKFFLPQEISRLESLPADQVAGTFLEIWTAKEALCKLAGEGIYRALREAEVTGGFGRFRGRAAHLHRFGGARGLAGTLATWVGVEVKSFEIGGISDREA